MEVTVTAKARLGKSTVGTKAQMTHHRLRPVSLV